MSFREGNCSHFNTQWKKIPWYSSIALFIQEYIVLNGVTHEQEVVRIHACISVSISSTRIFALKVQVLWLRSFVFGGPGVTIGV